MTVHMSKMSGKLKGIPAINTNTLTNLFCIQQHKTATICLDCYSFEMLEGYRKNCTPAFERNSALLSEHIPWDDLPVLNFAYVRYSAHGEIINYQHYLNLVRIALKNPQTTFVLWTKRASIVRQYQARPIRNMEESTVPDNLILIFSNPRIDRIIDVPRGFHKVFNNVAKGSTAPQNCTGKKCMDCLACYRKDSGTDVIVEMVK